MYRTAALKALREKLSAMNISAIIIPTNDPHFGEYTQDDGIVINAISVFSAAATRNAACNGLFTKGNQFGFNAVLFKNFARFSKRSIGTAEFIRTAIDQ